MFSPPKTTGGTLHPSLKLVGMQLPHPYEESEHVSTRSSPVDLGLARSSSSSWSAPLPHPCHPSPNPPQPILLLNYGLLIWSLLTTLHSCLPFLSLLFPLSAIEFSTYYYHYHYHYYYYLGLPQTFFLYCFEISQNHKAFFCIVWRFLKKIRTMPRKVPDDFHWKPGYSVYFATLMLVSRMVKGF